MNCFLLLAQAGLANPIKNLWAEPGFIITSVLISLPVLVAIWIVIIKAGKGRYPSAAESTNGLADSHHPSEPAIVSNPQVIRRVEQDAAFRYLPQKQQTATESHIQHPLTVLILCFFATSVFWLLFGTSVGEYLGIKFVAPEADHFSWLSFGRLRPVHTNAVFWGWASLAMVGLGYYVIPTVSNVRITSVKVGWASLILMNAGVLFGSIALMAGINNSGGEYREYIWPIMGIFAIGIIITLWNFYTTIKRRETEEIYISSWYMIAALIFVIVISTVAYLPFWQFGLGETITQGYYMHQGVGMWFMMYLLGLTYYFLPQQLNTPIYSYSLGMLAFWTQIFFYTVIGSHHFIFSAIPWSLQTVAIIGSMGMAIPVIAGTANFLLTFKGGFYKVANSYTLPFFLVGVVFYFSGSLQGTAEAFRLPNLAWHFTDFTVAHSHLTMYGIITFLLWGCLYSVVPRLTGKEPSPATVGAHFWMALVGLMFYTVPLMLGGTLRGFAWMEGVPFIDTVVMMAPYWLWRAIGGSLMWISHWIFAYNMYKMIKGCSCSKTPNAGDNVIANQPTSLA